MPINNFLKIGIIYAIWAWLKPRWKKFSCLVAYILVIWMIFLGISEWQELTDKEKWLYGAKWSLIILGIIVYFLFNLLNKPTTKDKMPDSNETLPNEKDDGFAFLRNKKKLSNRADKIIKEK